MSHPLFAGIDLGSISLNLVLIDDNAKIMEGVYERTHGLPLHTLLKMLHNLSERYASINNIFITGSGRQILSRLFSCNTINEIIAHGEGAAFLNPDVRTIIEIGGQDSKLIILNRDDKTGRTIISDNTMNEVCAAGTGSFLDQQAKRLGIPVEEMGDIALRSKHPAAIAGRCSVFAKSDMIHFQQEGVPVEDIVAGLCFALARGFLSNLGKGRELPRPIQFQGGVAANRGVVKAFETLLDLSPGGLVILENFMLMGGYGAALNARNEASSRQYPIKWLMDRLEEEIRSGRDHRSCLVPLSVRKAVNIPAPFTPPLSMIRPRDVFLGIDVGAASANLALLDMEGNVIGKRYLLTSGDPAEAVKRGLGELEKESGAYIKVKGVAVTGSGRYFIGHLVDADMVINEITAQAKGALHLDPSIDTLFEIGGQDAKYISLENGAVVDFEMNKVCAAGTGAFLEEQAARLNIDIKSDFSDLAFKASAPGDLGTRCTVFMESDLIHHQQSGLEKENLIAGLAYAIVNNYMEKVVENRRIGKNISFQGGVAGNSAVVAAMEQITGKRINVHEHHNITGAIGAALALKERVDATFETTFAGFNVIGREISVKTFTCGLCANLCDIRRICINGLEKGASGGICGRYDQHRESYADIPDLMEERYALLTAEEQELPPGSPLIGVPRGILFYENYPFWKAYFAGLGHRIILSEETSKGLLYKGLKRTQSETCLPVKVAYGHIVSLIEKGVEKIFFPSITEMSRTRNDLPRTYNCPYVQGLPYMMLAGFEENGSTEFLTPVLSFSNGSLREALIKLGEKLGKNRSVSEMAVNAAEEAQHRFKRELVERGRELLNKKDQKRVILLGKPYHLFDEGQNMHIGKKLRRVGITAIPYDFLPLSEVELGRAFENVVWKNSHDLMRAAMIARAYNIPVIILTNFGCGPDSFAVKYLKEILSGHPHMTLEVDEHTADAGITTRIEAFIDTIRDSCNHSEKQPHLDYNVIIKRDSHIRNPFRPDAGIMSLLKERTLYFHHVSPGMNRIMESAFSITGIKARSLPPQDYRTAHLGKRYSSGLECHPYIISTGDIIKLTEEPGFDPSKSAILLISYDGCCRYSQYGLSYKIALKNMGFPEVLIINPLMSGRYDELTGMFGLNFTQAIWKGLLSAGILENYLLSRRPYELIKGKTDEAYNMALDALAEAISKFSPVSYLYDAVLIKALKQGIGLIKSVSCNHSAGRPRVGVLGEFFSLLNSWSNQELFRKLEKMGVEVTSCGLFTLTNFISFFSERYHEEEMEKKHGLAGYYYSKIKKHWLMSWARRIEEELDDEAGAVRVLPTKKMIRDIGHLINPDLDPVSTTYLARTVDLADRGVSGINYLTVLNCMLSNVTIPIIKKILAGYNSLPFLSTAYDGFKETNTVTRLEAFVHQVKLYHERYGSSKGPTLYQ